MNQYELITIIGPTASGKTALAAALAARLDTEIISADSRQLYRGMDIGTGKDLADYEVDGKQIPYHLIDICDPGYKYNVFEYQHDFFKVFAGLCERGKLPILCGGTGLYVEAVLKGYKLLDVPPNPALRERLSGKSLAELVVSSEDDTVGLANGDPAGGFERLGRLVDEEGREVVVGQHPVGSPHKRAGHDTCFVEKSGVDLHLQFGGSATKARESVAQAVALGSASLAQGLLCLTDSLADAPQLGVERI